MATSHATTVKNRIPSDNAPVILRTTKERIMAHEESDDGAYIRGFLAKVKHLENCIVEAKYFEGRLLIERLALAMDADDTRYRWNAEQCATVLDFLSLAQPVKGTCFCHDKSYSEGNATAGLHLILYFTSEAVRRLAPKVKVRRLAAEVAHV